MLGTVILTLFLFILFDFIQRTTKYFAEYEPATKDIALFYLYQVPSQIVQALPIASLLASVITMILLSRTNEVTAMRAAGMNPWRIGLPLAAGGFALSLCSLSLGEWVVPQFAGQMHYVQKVKIEGAGEGENISGMHWMRDETRLINFREYDPVQRSLKQLKIIETGPNFRPIKSTEAWRAFYQPASDTWYLEEVRTNFFALDGTLVETVRISNQDLSLPIVPDKMRQERRKPNEMSFAELTELATEGDRSGANTLPYKVDLHAKAAYPFAAFVVSLIGLKFGYRSERNTETAKGILLAFAIGISYWFILSAGRALGNRGDLAPVVAAWLANVTILGLIVIDAWRARRG